MRACEVDADCGRVETSCGSCCAHVGINKRFEAEYDDSVFRRACSGYSGPVCECQPAATTPRCVDRVCQLLPLESKG